MILQIFRRRKTENRDRKREKEERKKKEKERNVQREKRDKFPVCQELRHLSLEVTARETSARETESE